MSAVHWCEKTWHPVLIGYVPDEEAWGREVSLMGCSTPWPMDQNTLGSTQEFELPDGGSIVLVTVNTDRLDYETTIVHEAVHCWQKICEVIGEDKPGDEIEAYSIQHIYQELKMAVLKHLEVENG